MKILLITAASIIATFLLFGSIESFFSDAIIWSYEKKWVFALVSYIILSTDVVLPVPSSLVMFTNGFTLGIFSGGLLSLFSSITSSILGYFLGKILNSKLSRQRVKTTKDFLYRYQGLAIVLSRGIPILSESVNIACGYLKIRFRHFLLLNFLGYLPVCFIYAYLGALGISQSGLIYAFIAAILTSALLFILGKGMMVNTQEKLHHHL